MPVVVVAVYVCLADPYCCCRFLEKLVCGVPLMIAYHIQFSIWFWTDHSIRGEVSLGTNRGILQTQNCSCFSIWFLISLVFFHSYFKTWIRNPVDGLIDVGVAAENRPLFHFDFSKECLTTQIFKKIPTMYGVDNRQNCNNCPQTTNIYQQLSTISNI